MFSWSFACFSFVFSGFDFVLSSFFCLVNDFFASCAFLAWNLASASSHLDLSNQTVLLSRLRHLLNSSSGDFGDFGHFGHFGDFGHCHGSLHQFYHQRDFFGPWSWGGVQLVQRGSLKIVLLFVLKASAVGRSICSYAVGALFLCFVSIWWLRVPSAQPWQCCFGLFSNQFSVGRAGWRAVGRVFLFVL